MANSNNKIIRQIRTGISDVYDISAKYLSDENGNEYKYDDIQKNIKDSFDEIRDIAQGAIETYVIPTSKNNYEEYGEIVNSTATTITTTISVLNNLTDGQENGGYKLGDIILIEAPNIEEKVFNRWVSATDGENVTLAVLENQVSTHHHTINIDTNISDALISKTVEETKYNVAQVGTPVSVVTGVSDIHVITSVNYNNNGNHTLGLSVVDEIDTNETGVVSFSEIVCSHTHSVSFKPSDFVSSTENVYNVLASATYTPHTHSTQIVAGAANTISDVSYVYGGQTETFVKTLSDTIVSTTSTALTTKQNSTGISTNTQVSTDTVGSDIQTLESGVHTHSVSTITDSNVVTSVSLSYTLPTVQTNVVTSIDYNNDIKAITSAKLNPTNVSFITSCFVDSSGVLSFNEGSAITSATIETSSKNVSTINSVSSDTQSRGSVNFTYTSGQVNSTGTAESSGKHTHGFSHIHTIDAHTHTIDAHHHEYTKVGTGSSATAYVSLSVSKFSTHSHDAKTVATAATNVSEFTYITGGETVSVVKTLKNSSQSLTTTSDITQTSDKYIKLTGTITHPGLVVTSSKLTSMVSTSTVAPAVTGGKVVASITFTSGNFVTSVTSGTINTSENKGGSPNVN